MGAFVKGDVIVPPFPFSDLSDTKKRPTLVVAALTGDDIPAFLLGTPNRLHEYGSAAVDTPLLRPAQYRRKSP